MSNISKKTLDFIKDLKKNNNREWFNENKARYTAAREEFVDFVTALIPQLAKFDPKVADQDPKKSVFRIYRDTRFSKDKTPYKTNLGGHVLPGGKSNVHSAAGYYIHLEPGNCFLAGGAYLPPGPWISAIRQEIDFNAKEFKKILNGKKFKEYFGEIEGDKLKTAPKGYPKDHPEIELLRYKSLLAVHRMSDKQVLAPDFLKHATGVFKVLYPFDAFLNRAMH